MPLRCIDTASGKTLYAFDLERHQFADLKVLNTQRQHLRLPCCDASVTLKVSNKGTQFFAHRASSDHCTSGPETEAHLRIKALAVQIARSKGWVAGTEIRGTTPSGTPWIADVLARRGEKTVAVEVQWSRQYLIETQRRQEQYRESGVRGLWLFRQKDTPCEGAIPAARLVQGEDAEFLVELPYTDRGPLPASKFLEGVFSDRLSFGIPKSGAGTASAWTGPMSCYKCQGKTSIVTRIVVEVGRGSYGLSVPDFTGMENLLSFLSPSFLRQWNVGPLKPRFSKTQERSYLSNGCIHCDALIGQFHEHEAWSDQSEVLRVPISMSDGWRAAIAHSDNYVPHWDLY